MMGEQVDPDKIDRVEQTLKGFQLTFQEITETLVVLVTQVHAPQG